MLPAMAMTHMQPHPLPMTMTMPSTMMMPQQYNNPMGFGGTGGGWPSPNPHLPQAGVGGVGTEELMALRQMERAVEQLERENASLFQGGRQGQGLGQGPGQGQGLGGDQLDSDNSSMGSMGMSSMASTGNNATTSGSRFGGNNNNNLNSNNNNNNNSMLTQQQRVQQLRADKLSRLDLQHEEDMMMMQYEMEKIKQKRALDELKATLAEETEEQLAKDRQMSWLVDQKQRLNEMKVKQAMAKERLVLKQLLFDQEQAMVSAMEHGPHRGNHNYMGQPGSQLQPQFQLPSCFDVKVTPEHVR